MIRLAFVTVVPSPYQRDLFAALAARPEISLRVYYMERTSPDSPWPERPLAPYEKYLRGFWLPIGHARVHLNWNLPTPRDLDIIVCNTLMSVTGQWMMRSKLSRARWMFWGEKLGPRSAFHDFLTHPLHHAAAIAAIGSWAERDYAGRFPKTRVFNIPYHCDLQPFLDAPRGAREPGTVTFLFCGQMIERKGIAQLIDAFGSLPSNARLLLTGREAELNRLLATIPDAVRERIRYTGFQSPEALPGIFAQADVFVLPSRYDGWGVVVNQALGAGLPIIASDQVGAAFDLVRDGRNGFVFPAGNTTALAGAMQRYLTEPSLCEIHGTASRHSAHEWTPKAGAARWVNALQTVCA